MSTEASEEAGRLLRQARSLSGMSQQELGRRAGVPQSVISAYENARRQPSLPTLRKLVDTTGLHLTIEMRPAARTLPRTRRGELLARCRPALRAAVVRRGGQGLRVFGSVARGDDDADSDIDLLVDLPDGTSLTELVGLRRELSGVLGEPVDLLPVRALRPEVRAAAEREAVPL